MYIGGLPFSEEKKKWEMDGVGWKGGWGMGLSGEEEGENVIRLRIIDQLINQLIKMPTVAV